MNQSASKWVVALLLVAFPLACLILTFYLIHSPPQLEEEETIVPRPAVVDRLPALADISHIPERKQTFIELLLPMIEWRNSQLLDRRQEIKSMLDQLANGQPLKKHQQERLQNLRLRFKVTEESYPETEAALSVLWRRVDIIPTDMVLAQAAAESGWGTSRFAVEANNIFGHWCFRQGCGLVPSRRPEGANAEVEKFATVNDALDAYYININTHRAYRELRRKRAQLREQSLPIAGEILVGELSRYSSRGQAYVEELRELIRYNDLVNAGVAKITETHEG